MNTWAWIFLSILFLGFSPAMARETGETQQESIQLSEEELQQYVGDFWEPTDAFAAETRLEEGKLWAVHSPERRNELVPIGQNRFQMTGMPVDVIVEFEMSDRGIVSVNRFIEGKARGRFTPFTRRQATTAELLEYSGEYLSTELDVEYVVGVFEDHLLLQIEDEPPHDLTPMFNDTFENPDLGAFEFLRGPEGNIASFRLQSGRVRNLMFYRKL